MWIGAGEQPSGKGERSNMYYHDSMIMYDTANVNTWHAFLTVVKSPLETFLIFDESRIDRLHFNWHLFQCCTKMIRTNKCFSLARHRLTSLLVDWDWREHPSILDQQMQKPCRFRRNALTSKCHLPSKHSQNKVARHVQIVCSSFVGQVNF